MTDGLLLGGAAFTGIVAFSVMICFLWSLGCGTLARYAQGRPVRLFECHELGTYFLPLLKIFCVSSFGRPIPLHRTSQMRNFSLGATEFEFRRLCLLRCSK